jgi:hypothetical protein
MKENNAKHNTRMMTMTRRGLLAACIPASLAAQPFSRDDWGGRGNFQSGGLYEIVNVENGRVLDLDRNNGRTVIQFEPRGTRNQLWELRQSGAGRYNIVNAMNGAALAELSPRRSTPIEAFPLRGGGGRRGGMGAGPQMEWRIESYRDGSVMFISYSGNAIDIPDGTRRNGVQVQTYSRNGDGNQRFFLRPVNGGGGGRGYRDGRDWDRDNRRPPY